MFSINFNIAVCLKNTTIVRDNIQIKTAETIKITADNSTNVNFATDLKIITTVRATIQIQTATHIKLSTNINTTTLIKECYLIMIPILVT